MKLTGRDAVFFPGSGNALWLPQVESTQGTPLANTADVSLQITTDSVDEATITELQLTNLLQNSTAMSVSMSIFPFASLPSSLSFSCVHGMHTYNAPACPHTITLRGACVEAARQLLAMMMRLAHRRVAISLVQKGRVDPS